MDWLRITLPSSEVPSGRYAKMFGLFNNAFKLAGAPADFAVMEYSPKYGEHDFYFSPTAVTFGGSFLQEYSAVISDAPPSNDETTLLIGRADAKARLLHSPRFERDGK